MYAQARTNVAAPWHALPNPSDFDDPEWLALANAIYSGVPSQAPIDSQPWYHKWNHRKVWETTQLAYGLIKHGVVHEGAWGLGVGVGTEPLIYFFARRIERIFATDMYGYGWGSAPMEMLWNAARFAPYDYPAERLIVLQMDGRQLLFPDEQFDFVYSISSMEHFGGWQGALSHLQEAARVLKRGGIVAFTTELALAGHLIPDWCFRIQTLCDIIACSGLTSLHPLVCEPHPVLLEQPATLQLPEWKIRDEELDRLSVRLGDLIYTSIVVLLQKTK